MQTFDVVAVDLITSAVRHMRGNVDWANAEATVEMAVMRRGVDEEFFAVTTAGMYVNGEVWHGNGGAQDPNPSDPAATIKIINGVGFPIGPRGLER